MTRAIVVAILVALAGCGSDEPFTDCAMGELTGAWRVSYTERDGNCGPIQDANLVLTPGEVPAECTVRTFDISPDKCEMTTDIECPTDGGTVRTVDLSRQIGPDEISGSVTVTVDLSSGFCRSTYDTRVVRL